MMIGKLENLRTLLKQGHAPRDLVAEGYPRASVYKAARQLRRGGKRRASGKGDRGGGQARVRRYEVLSCMEPEDESMRSEIEARGALIAERRAGKQPQELELRARGEALLNKALAAHSIGGIDSSALLFLASGGNTLPEIERKEKLLGHLESWSIARAEEARDAASTAERERGRREAEELERRGERLFRHAIWAFEAGRIDSYTLVYITSHRDTLAEVEEGEKLLRYRLWSSGNTSAG
jgi:hypothetical protein